MYWKLENHTKSKSKGINSWTTEDFQNFSIKQLALRSSFRWFLHVFSHIFWTQGAKFSPPQPCMPSSKPPVRLNQARPMATKPPPWEGRRWDVCFFLGVGNCNTTTLFVGLWCPMTSELHLKFFYTKTNWLLFPVGFITLSLLMIYSQKSSRLSSSWNRTSGYKAFHVDKSSSRTGHFDGPWFTLIAVDGPEIRLTSYLSSLSHHFPSCINNARCTKFSGFFLHQHEDSFPTSYPSNNVHIIKLTSTNSQGTDGRDKIRLIIKPLEICILGSRHKLQASAGGGTATWYPYSVAERSGTRENWKLGSFTPTMDTAYLRGLDDKILCM